MASLSDAPWSAAFISWVVKNAVPNIPFPYNALHTKYASDIRHSNTVIGGYDGIPGTVTPDYLSHFELLDPNSKGIPREWQVGDIVIRVRSGNNIQFSDEWTGPSHADIVISDRIGVGGTVVGGNLSDSVTSRTITSTADYFVIIRAKHSDVRRQIAREAQKELNRWKANKWTNENQPGARERVNQYRAVVGLPQVSALKAQGSTTPLTGISPFIHSLESFHPNIQYELTRRRVSAETANVYMPFVKLTSLTKIVSNATSNNLPDGVTSAYCPSLGIHGQNNVSFNDIYLPTDNRSVIGYAITDEGRGTTPVVVSDAARDAKHIPIPGITQLTAERSTAGPMGVRGGLLKADLKIVAYSVGQVDALLRYFLRPATRVVLELGKMSANQREKITPFDWRKSESYISDYFSELIKSSAKQKEFIKDYIYNNNGNYEAFIAYVVKFNLKYNKNNTFEIDLTLHSVQQFEVPTTQTAVQSMCAHPIRACNVMDIQEYFSEQHSWKDNSFKTLMSYYQGNEVKGTTINENELEWKSHIVPIKNTENSQIGGGSTQAGTRENEYFVSWKFFIEKILNDKQYGIASMLGDNTSIAELALLRPTKEPDASSDTGLIANQVGYHSALRSVSPDVMIIYNPEAQTKYKQSNDDDTFESFNVAAAAGDKKVLDTLHNNAIEQQIIGSNSAVPPFANTSKNGGASYLTQGIWINTNAIKEAFTTTDTITAAISSLLTKMNAATEGYWNLQLYSTDVNNPGLHVIDMGLSKPPKLVSGDTPHIDNEETETNNILNSITGITPKRYQGATTDEPQYIYMFNRGTKIFNDGELGSDLLDLNVEFNLPLVIAVQAIVNIGGPAQKSTLQSIDVEELQKISLIGGLYAPCKNPTDDADCESDEIRRLREEAVTAQRELDNSNRKASNSSPPATDAQHVAEDAKQRNLSNNVTNTQTKLDAAKAYQSNPNLVGVIREYADLGTALQLIEINPSRMMNELNADSIKTDEGNIPAKVHAFNSSNLTKTVIDVTLPGIGGIGLFQSFLVDRIPSIMERGFYVVTKVTHDFTTQNGWITKIQGRFRFRPKIEGLLPTVTIN